MAWTIKTDSQERTIEDWGISDLKRVRQSQTVGYVTLLADGRALDASDLFPYGSTVIVMRDRVYGPGGWSGGRRWFYGRVEPWERGGSENGEAHFGRLVDPWWYLTELVFEREWRLWSGWTGEGIDREPTFETRTTSHVILNLTTDLVNHPNAKLTTGEQITEILQWAISKGAPIQIGEILPSLDVPIDEDKNLTCEGAIQKELSWSPDAICDWDMTTLPYPTLNIYRLQDLVDRGRRVNIDVNRGRPTNKLNIKPRPDWARPFVRLIFEQEVDGYMTSVEDIWPNPLPAGPENNFRGLVSTVNLMGWAFSRQRGPLVCEPINEESKDWWKNGRSSEADKAGDITLYPATATRQSLEDAPYDESLTNELLDGNLAEWMSGIKGQRVRVSIQADVTSEDGSKKIQTWLTHDLTATNAVTGNYSTTSISQYGDPVPFGLARFMWEALQGLSVEGSITEVDEEVSAQFEQWQLLNFISPLQPDWANVDALPQRITDSVRDGVTSIEFGAPDHLNPNQLVALLRVMRTRIVFINPDLPATGSLANQNLSLGNRVPRKNTQIAAGTHQRLVIADLQLPDARGLGIDHKVSSENQICSSFWGAGDPTAVDESMKGSIFISVKQALGRDIALRWFPICINNQQYKVLLLGSAPEPGAPDS